MIGHRDTPGREAERVARCVSDHCVTCGDVAEPMTVLAIDHHRELALCGDRNDGRFTVEIALVQPVRIGDDLLVHAGTAISKADGAP